MTKVFCDKCGMETDFGSRSFWDVNPIWGGLIALHGRHCTLYPDLCERCHNVLKDAFSLNTSMSFETCRAVIMSRMPENIKNGTIRDSSLNRKTDSQV